MDIEFKRNRVQEYLEKVIDPSYVPTRDKNALKLFKIKAEGYRLSHIDCIVIDGLIKQDAYDYYYSATVSFINALEDIYLRNYSWSTIELYYTVYYLMRVELHLSNIALFRVAEHYNILTAAGESIKKIGNGNTHESVIKLFKKYFPSDLILLNKVDGEDSIDWLKNNREIVNYKSVNFKDPDCYSFFQKFRNPALIKRNLRLIINDPDFIYVFQPEFAMLGIPLIFFKEIISRNAIKPKHILDNNRKLHIEDKIQKLDVGFLRGYWSL